MRSAGNLFETTRSVQFGSFCAPPCRQARISGGVIRSLPGQRGHIPSRRGEGSGGNSWGRLARSVEMMTQRPTIGSLRSSVIWPPIAGERREGTGRTSLPDLFLLGDGLAIDAQGGDRPGDQPLLLDLPPAPVADPERASLDPLDGLLDLHQELPVPVPETEGEVPVRLEEGAVGGIREVLLGHGRHVRHRFLRARHELVQLPLELRPALFEDAAVHRDKPPGERLYRKIRYPTSPGV